MALPLLPAEHIQPAFDELVDHLPDDVDERVADLVHYVRSTWIESRLWPAAAWSAFRSFIRTNNDVEGWHNRLNQQSRRGKLDIYQLAPLLFEEAQFVSLQAVLVTENRVRRYQKSVYRRIQGRLFQYWERYADGEISTSQLLRKCAYVYGPANTNA